MEKDNSAGDDEQDSDRILSKHLGHGGSYECQAAANDGCGQPWPGCIWGYYNGCKNAGYGRHVHRSSPLTMFKNPDNFVVGPC